MCIHVGLWQAVELRAESAAATRAQREGGATPSWRLVPGPDGGMVMSQFLCDAVAELETRREELELAKRRVCQPETDRGAFRQGSLYALVSSLSDAPALNLKAQSMVDQDTVKRFQRLIAIQICIWVF